MTDSSTRTVRWLDPSSNASDELRRVLRAGGAQSDDAARLARLESRLVPLLNAPVSGSATDSLRLLDAPHGADGAGSTAGGPGASIAGPNALLTGFVGKVVVAVCLSGGGAALLHVAFGPDEPARGAIATAATSVPLPGVEPRERSNHAAPPPVDSGPDIQKATASRAKPAVPRAASGRMREAERREADPDGDGSDETPARRSTLTEEAALLSQARRLARSDPRAAVRYLDQHATMFPDGVLRQERELFRIELFARGGDLDGAQAGLEALPADSPHLERAQRALTEAQKAEPLPGSPREEH
jgi:hypothetical protein